MGNRTAGIALKLAAVLAFGTGCSSSSSSATAGDAGATDSVDEIDLDEGTFTVPAGQEVVYCVRIPMPAKFQGRDLALAGWDSDVAAPAHHYFMFYDTKSTGGTTPVPCMGNDPSIPAATAGLNLFSTGTLMLVSGVGQNTGAANADYGMVLPANGTFVTNHHVINAGAQPVTVHGTFKLKVKDATAVAHPTRALSCQTTDISLPAGVTTDIAATCIAPYDLDVVAMSSHAHQDLVKFEQRFYDGQQTQPDVLYTSTQWDNPSLLELPTPLHLKAGQGITFTCSFKNDTQATIGFGLTATSEMCAAMNQYAYPADKLNTVPPMLGTTVFANATPSMLTNTAKSAIPLF